MTIIVARLVDDSEVIGEARVDLGELRKVRQIKRAEACCWLNKGTNEDLTKAMAWASANGYEVLTFPVGETNVLDKARDQLLKVWKNKST